MLSITRLDYKRKGIQIVQITLTVIHIMLYILFVHIKTHINVVLICSKQKKIALLLCYYYH
eukprot:UN02423